MSADQVRTVFEYWKQVTKHERSHLDSKRARLIADRLADGYTPDDLMLACFGCAHSRFHQGENDRRQVYDSIELIFRNADKLDAFMRLGEQAKARLAQVERKAHELTEQRVHASQTGAKYLEARGRLLSIVGGKG